ncbi:MAG: LytR/AlgR family response regulator transcription factor [Gemmatimonadales bacterium]
MSVRNQSWPDAAHADAAALARTLVIEDEPLARRALRAIIDGVPWLQCVGEAADAAQAVEMIRSADPQLIFLDVRLPGGSGIAVLERAPTNAVVIFATAFDSYALAAFELGAIDYITKPFGPERVHRALARARAQLQAQSAAEHDQPPTAAAPAGVRLGVVQARPLETIFARERGSIVPIGVPDIVRCEADGDFVAVYAHGKRYLLYLNLSDLSAQLDPTRFVRVHRSHIVNLSAVQSIAPLDASRVEICLRDGSRVSASRTGTGALRSRMRSRHST